jgi:hypothetical protein
VNYSLSYQAEQAIRAVYFDPEATWGQRKAALFVLLDVVRGLHASASYAAEHDARITAQSPFPEHDRTRR